MSDADGSVTGRPAATSRWLFVATILLGSFLLFLMQPLVARMALPRLGGAPAVWNSAMLVYQLLLLGGYAYAHALGRVAPRVQAAVHLAVLGVAAMWLPLALGPQTPPSGASPAWWTPWLLLGSIGPLFFAVSAQAPLMQRWFASRAPGANPYALYAASNLGSFGGLIAYPLLAEPLFGLAGQSLAWTVGYVLLAVMVAACGLALPRTSTRAAAPPVGAAPGWREWARWIALAAVPSGLMLSTTAHLTTDVVAVPLIWVIPLGLYLLSFTIAFGRDEISDTIALCLPIIMLVAGGAAFRTSPGSPWASAILGLSLLFTVAVTLHHALYRARPDPSWLTAFYLAMAIGGVIGGCFCALAAPLLFDWVYEHPLLILAAGLLAPQSYFPPRMARLWRDTRRARWLTVGIGVAALLLSVGGSRMLPPALPGWGVIAVTVAIAVLAAIAIGRPKLFTLCLGALMLAQGGWDMLILSFTTDARTRSYFGVYTIADRKTGARDLVHGTTLHGTQWRVPGRERWPTSYYVEQSGVGRALSAAPALFGPGARIGVVGLGTGTLACYAQPGQSWRFYEIDAAVAGIARDPRWFSFLSRCKPDAAIVMGDARLMLAQPSARHEILVIDAFSSDAVPMHLLTREAFAVYSRAVPANGLLMIHISNRYINLEPVLAAQRGWHMARLDYVPSRAERSRAATASSWVAASRDPQTIVRLMAAERGDPADWRALKPRAGFTGWSDDHGSILPLLRSTGSR